MKIQRNAPCPCQSNKKYKKCCLAKAERHITLVISNEEPDTREQSSLFLELFPEAEQACETLLKQLDADNDIAQFKKAANILYQLYPTSHSVHFLQGYACIKEGKLENAIPHLKKAIDLFPYFSTALCNLGIVYSELNQIFESVQYLRQVLEIEEVESEIYQAAQTHLQELEDFYQDALSITLDEYLPVERLYNQARACMTEKKYEEAIKLFQEVVAIAPRYIQAHNNLGVSYATLGQYSLALEHCEKTLAIDPANQIALLNKFQVLPMLEEEEPKEVELRDFTDIVKDFQRMSL